MPCWWWCVWRGYAAYERGVRGVAMSQLRCKHDESVFQALVRGVSTGLWPEGSMVIVGGPGTKQPTCQDQVGTITVRDGERFAVQGPVQPQLRQMLMTPEDEASNLIAAIDALDPGRMDIHVWRKVRTVLEDTWVDDGPHGLIRPRTRLINALDELWHAENQDKGRKR